MHLQKTQYFSLNSGTHVIIFLFLGNIFYVYAALKHSIDFICWWWILTSEMCVLY